MIPFAECEDDLRTISCEEFKGIAYRRLIFNSAAVFSLKASTLAGKSALHTYWDRSVPRPFLYAQVWVLALISRSLPIGIGCYRYRLFVNGSSELSVI